MKKINLLKPTLAIALLTLVNLHVFGQSKDLEIGLRANSLSGLKELNSFIFKTGKEENKFTRYRFAIANLYLFSQKKYASGSMTIQFAFGTEKRVGIGNKLYFIHGLEPMFSFEFGYVHSNNLDDSYSLSVSPGLGYVLGFQYDILERLYLSIETIPYLSTTFRTGNFVDDYFSLNAKMNTSDIALSLVYKFKIRND